MGAGVGVGMGTRVIDVCRLLASRRFVPCVCEDLQALKVKTCPLVQAFRCTHSHMSAHVTFPQFLHS